MIQTQQEGAPCHHQMAQRPRMRRLWKQENPSVSPQGGVRLRGGGMDYKAGVPQTRPSS